MAVLTNNHNLYVLCDLNQYMTINSICNGGCTDNRVHMNAAICMTEAVTSIDTSLNQVRAGPWLARTWFLRIASVRKCLYVCVCPPPKLLTSDMM